MKTFFAIMTIIMLFIVIVVLGFQHQSLDDVNEHLKDRVEDISRESERARSEHQRDLKALSSKHVSEVTLLADRYEDDMRFAELKADRDCLQQMAELHVGEKGELIMDMIKDMSRKIKQEENRRLAANARIESLTEELKRERHNRTVLENELSLKQVKIGNLLVTQEKLEQENSNTVAMYRWISERDQFVREKCVKKKRQLNRNQCVNSVMQSFDEIQTHWIACDSNNGDQPIWLSGLRSANDLPKQGQIIWEEGQNYHAIVLCDQERF